MIAYLKGKIILRRANFLIVEVGSVGYKVFTKNPFEIKDNIGLYIHHYLRENISSLYGFASATELDTFEKLLCVSGVGPKAALSIIASLSPEEIAEAVDGSNMMAFKAIAGIGAKVAAKIVVELKGKISLSDLDFDSISKDKEAVEALQALGYKQKEILPYLKNIPSNLNETKDIIRYLLKNVGKSK
ncbi:Holliday junction branch migration protein RuvA [Candidatus Berkelbacteria bacterium CG10_big_fil_rev_8_21_14_0_10_41_12]|uniref:Holliday junction branch migration complex subunit RuvA n=1 Tax=Candidatus Berkelbacteria bacterium CG10_big_fil_rev_8_21_14_0_10_41_12 TaxID=1974513 RepID=A0A2M6WXE7_9BACT|nr:MAG: Holliday junction branch migration protein RuvA [Candidatus Berkelbacteria bacterium CG10_big_fil_rev_8_21_14_0_10_41_12]